MLINIHFDKLVFSSHMKNVIEIQIKSIWAWKNGKLHQMQSCETACVLGELILIKISEVQMMNGVKSGNRGVLN